MITFQRLLFIIFFFSIASISLLAQSPETFHKLEIYLYPKDGIVKIDTTVIDFRGKQQPIVIELPEGEHKLEAWSPRMNIQDTMITVSATKANRVRVKLKTSEDFETYKTQLHEYSIKKALAYSSIGIGATATFLAFDPFLQKKYNSARDRVQMEKTQYEEAIAPDVIKSAGSKYNDALSDYDKIAKSVNRRRLIGIPIMLASSGLSIYSIRKIKKTPKPKYQYKPSPFSNIRLQSDFSSTAMGTVNGVSLKLNF